MSERMEGAAREFGGRVQEAVGDVAGDARTQANGRYNQVAGQAQQSVGQLTDMIKAQPLLSALVAVGVGYVLGRLTA